MKITISQEGYNPIIIKSTESNIDNTKSQESVALGIGIAVFAPYILGCICGGIFAIADTIKLNKYIKKFKNLPQEKQDEVTEYLKNIYSDINSFMESLITESTNELTKKFNKIKSNIYQFQFVNVNSDVNVNENKKAKPVKKTNLSKDKLRLMISLLKGYFDGVNLEVSYNFEIDKSIYENSGDDLIDTMNKEEDRIYTEVQDINKQLLDKLSKKKYNTVKLKRFKRLYDGNYSGDYIMWFDVDLVLSQDKYNKIVKPIIDDFKK